MQQEPKREESEISRQQEPKREESVGLAGSICYGSQQGNINRESQRF